MNKKSDHYRNQSKDSRQDPLDTYIDKMVEQSRSSSNNNKSSGQAGRIIIAIIIVFIGISFVTGTGFFSSSGPTDVISSVTNMGGPTQDLLDRMGERMVEMGYGDLSDDDLRSLREDGVTATYVSNVRSLGFENLTLDDARRLARADASSTFMAMMIELGYDLTIDDFVQLRDAGVTAYYTSNVHDLGYKDVTPDQLIRMQRIGVSTSLIEELQAQRGEDVPLEDIIRYRISNQ
ncbi:hypothetical protein [Rhodohalobacter sp. 8-1]|uniref:hypothetical protein n=1 Tax=Rhodohalobacter sp. 8-1 TaxID=3131972 RepID=UPI0030EDC3BB